VKRVVIVGGGITGLATAVHLRDRAAEVEGGLEVVVLEAEDHPGGNVRTERFDGFTIEQGPNGFLDNAPATLRLVRRLGLERELQRADDDAARRYLYRGGRLHQLPSGPISFLRSPVLSLGGRMRVLAEPFARSRPAERDESVYDFAARRIGPEAAAVLVDAMVSGVFAGNVHELSLQSAFPKMARMESEHGSLVKAMVAGAKQRRAALRRSSDESGDSAGGEAGAGAPARAGGPAGPGGTLTSFRRGLDTLVEGLSLAAGDSLTVRTRVAGIRSGEGEAGPRDRMEARLRSATRVRRWDVHTAAGDIVDADAVVVAIPAPRAATLLEPLDPALGLAVREIKTAPLAVIALGYGTREAPAIRGFGFLVPRGTGPRILGCLWDSSIFPGRAPEGRILLRAMIGGAHDPEAVGLDDDALVDRVLTDLRATMDLNADPVLTRIYRWPLGIAQYQVGHQDRLDRIHGRLSQHPGLWVAGSSFYGVSMNACFEKAPLQADEILTFLSGGGRAPIDSAGWG
jgi:protoporphyrinogen/coproporphyrinogen III oxidase